MQAGSFQPNLLNISQEIQKMIPVRGPTQFERQMHEFVNGVTSKSGLKKTISTRTSTQRKPSAINLNEDNAKTTTSPKT